LETAIRRDGPITMARFRDAVGTTRKHAVPLMEWFDATGVTVRDGDVRALRAAR
jgi:selenocysteine-specific elongation factor